MSIRHVDRISKAAASLFVFSSVALTVSTVSADSSTHAEAARSAQRLNPTSAVCTTIDRPKHVIRRCTCTPSPISNVASIDAAEILRLLTGERGCQSPSAPSQ
jgi:hypothetical protein